MIVLVIAAILVAYSLIVTAVAGHDEQAFGPRLYWLLLVLWLIESMLAAAVV